MRLPGLAALVVAMLLSGSAMAGSERSDGCAEFHGMYELDRGASDVYIAGRDADGEGTCFLVPRSITHKLIRDYLVDAGLVDTVGFDVIDLLGYLDGKDEIVVGNLRREVPADLVSCLRSPIPVMIQVFSGDLPDYNGLDRFVGHASELPSEMPGYRRFREEGWRADYYVSLDQQREVKSFECGPYEGDNYACAVNGGHRRTRILVGFWKKDMPAVSIEKSLQCARSVADLFRLK